MLPAGTPDSVAAAAAPVNAMFMAADFLAIHFQRQVTRTLQTIYTLAALMGVLPLMAAIREAYAQKRAEKELVKQYLFMARIYGNARRQLEAAGSDAVRRKILKALGDAALEEHAQWLLTHRERPLEHSRMSSAGHPAGDGILGGLPGARPRSARDRSGGILMGIVGWLLLIAMAVALGYSVGRLWPGTAAKITELERERDLAREDLRNYRSEVSQHFERTAELFDKVTADYRGLYEHLAVGARQLGAIRGEAVSTRLVEPEQRRLAAVPSAGQELPPEPPEAAEDEAPLRPPRDYDESPEPESEPEAELNSDAEPVPEAELRPETPGEDLRREASPETDKRDEPPAPPAAR